MWHWQYLVRLCAKNTHLPIALERLNLSIVILSAVIFRFNIGLGKEHDTQSFKNFCNVGDSFDC